MSNRNNKSFEKDLMLWKDISSSFGDIVAEANDDDDFEWHVTITRNDYKFHFMVFWYEKCPIQQPKILLVFDQRCMISSSYFKGSWVILDNIKYFTITSVLLGLRNIVRSIDLTNVNKGLFNIAKCIYCHFGTKKNNDDTESVSNSSVVSLTVSQTSNISISTTTTNGMKPINNSNKEILVDIEADQALKKQPIPQKIAKTIAITKKSTNNKVSTKNKTQKIITCNNYGVNNKINSSKPRTKSWSATVIGDSNKKNQKAVRYLDTDINGCLVYKWTVGRRS